MNKEVTTKARNWFLTINYGAECLHTFQEKIKGFEKVQYSYILHDKDNEEQPHFHLCILFENARTFETMQKHFPGAHIEVMESKFKCFRYLLHLDDADKYQYELSQVVERGNNVEYYIAHDEYIKLDTESLLENIKNGSICDIYDAVKIYGLKQCNLYKNIIKDLLEYRFKMDAEVDYVKAYNDLKVQYNDLYQNNVDLVYRNVEMSRIFEDLSKKYQDTCRELARLRERRDNNVY